jgi:hypothetical protein
MKSGEKADPPIRCTVTDISSGACFLRTDSPFPLETRVEMSLCVADCRVRTEGKIRVMHPEFGMGVEFSSKTREHQILMKEIIARLTLSDDLVPEVLVEPEGLDWGNDFEALSGDSSVPAEMEKLEDTLLDLFRTGALLPKEQFLVELRSSDGGLQIVARPISAGVPNCEPRPLGNHPTLVRERKTKFPVRACHSLQAGEL